MPRHSFGDANADPLADILATRGYAILYPNIPLRRGQGMHDMAAAVRPALDAAVAAEFADPSRMAVMGQSHGSWSVLALITQTQRFKAAIISGAVVHPDALAGYLSMSSDGTDTTSYYESGQFGLTGTPVARQSRAAAHSAC